MRVSPPVVLYKQLSKFFLLHRLWVRIIVRYGSSYEELILTGCELLLITKVATLKRFNDINILFKIQSLHLCVRKGKQDDPEKNRD